MAKVNDILKIANSRIGIKENPPNSNNVDCNTWYYGHPVKGSAYPWCCVEMMYVFHLANADKLLMRTASCTTLMNWFKKNGKYTTTPHVGDLVFYNFDKKKDVNKAKHIGIVVEVGNGYVYSIEGNTSADSKGSQDNGGMVARRKRNLSSIVGFGMVDYSDSVPVKPATEHRQLKLGCVGDDVKELHKELRKHQYGVYESNNKFDATTQACVMHFQTVNHLKVDGIVGKETYKALGMM